MNSQILHPNERRLSVPAAILIKDEGSEGGRHLGEFIENRLGITDFTAIQDLFMVSSDQTCTQLIKMVSFLQANVFEGPFTLQAFAGLKIAEDVV